MGFLDREYEYYTGLMARGVQKVRFLTYGTEDKALEARIQPIEVLPKSGVKHALLYSLLAPFLHWKSFRDSDLIKSNQSNGAWVGILAKVVKPAGKLITRCGWVRTDEMLSRHENLRGWRRRRAEFIENMCYKMSDAVVVTTDSDKNFLTRHYGLREDKVVVIPNTVDTSLFIPDRNSMDVLHRPARVLTVGRLAHMKNTHNLIEAVGMLEGRASLTVVGGGDYSDELKRIAKKQNCVIRFEDNIDNSSLPDVYREHDIFIMPQLYASGMSKVMIEAMACGLVTVGSDLQAHREVISQGRNGFLCGFDAQGIADCLSDILALDDTQLRHIRADARRDVVHKYSMEANVDREYALYRSLLGHASAVLSNQQH